MRNFRNFRQVRKVRKVRKVRNVRNVRNFRNFRNFRTARNFRNSATPGMQGGGCNTETHLTVLAGRHPARVSLRSPVSPCGPRVGLCRARLRCAPSHDTPHFFDKPSSEQDTETSASSLRRVYSRGLAVLWERQQQRQTTPVR